MQSIDLATKFKSKKVRPLLYIAFISALQVTKHNISKTGESNVYTNPKYFAEVIDLATPHINYDLDRHELCYDYAGECCANQSRYSTIIPDSGCFLLSMVF